MRSGGGQWSWDAECEMGKDWNCGPSVWGCETVMRVTGQRLRRAEGVSATLIGSTIFFNGLAAKCCGAIGPTQDRRRTVVSDCRFFGCGAVGSNLW